MKKTEIVFILDRSGSMSGLEEDTIGGYNGMLKKQKNKDGEALVTTVLFDNEYEMIHNRTDIQGIQEITEEEYFVRGTTALLDAIGITISKIIQATKNTRKESRASKVIFVIITDGMENASKEYNYKRIKEMVEYQKENYNWEFVFLGANIDAIKTAASFGINEDRAANYHSDEKGTELNYKAVNNLITDVRMEKKVTVEWKEEINKDYKKRGKDKRN